jgi:protein TonB
VRLKVVVGRDGTVSDAEFLEGNSLLAPAAIDAVNQWRYSPTLLNCVPVEVETEVIVSFRPEGGEAQPRRP